MRFYTNVQMVGDNFLVRGYEDGKHFATREKFYPTLFVDSKRKTKYKTLDGPPVEPIEPGTVRDCREFIKKYNDVENFNVYGNERFIYQYISEKYPEVEVKFDNALSSKISLETELSESLYETMKDFVLHNPTWDQYKLINSALATFLVQNGCTDNSVSEIYLNQLFTPSKSF